MLPPNTLPVCLYTIKYTVIIVKYYFYKKHK